MPANLQRAFDLKTGLLANGLIMADVDGANVLIDTGSPVTLGPTAGSLVLAGEEIVVTMPPPAFDLERIGGRIGERIDVLLGMDAIDRLGFVVHLGDGPTVGFPGGETPAAPEPGRGVQIPLRLSAGVPTASCGFPTAGTTSRAIIDTGAAVSFAAARFLQAHAGDPVGVWNDFWISADGVMELESPRWEFDVEIGGIKQTQKFVEMPTSMAAALNGIGVGAIIGTGLLLAEGNTQFAFERGMLTLRFG